MAMRDSGDCAANHVNGAFHIRLAGLAGPVGDLSAEIVPMTECRKDGGRSAKGAELPRRLGRIDAFWREGGTTGWLKGQSRTTESKRGEARMRLKTVFAAASVALGLANPPAFAQDAAIEVMQEYLMFSEYEAGIILPPQIDQAVFESVLFVDTRDAEQFEAATIPGAIHI